jgi:hypothetical protein
MSEEQISSIILPRSCFCPKFILYHSRISEVEVNIRRNFTLVHSNKIFIVKWSYIERNM